jgi:peptidyl-prolyl cis-trans isomerase C
VLAKVGNDTIHMSDVAEAAANVPELKNVPPQQAYPMVLDRLISMAAVADAARRAGIDKNPEVAKQLARATDEVLSNALLSIKVGPSVTPEAINAIYQKDYANKPGAEEVHARHILVPTEEEAKKVIAELKGGADFAKTAAKYSKEPGAADRGGDLGFFAAGDMVPEFSNAAFAMKPGTFSDTPVHTQFGWHVIKVEERRAAPPKTLEQATPEIRQALIREGVDKVVKESIASTKIERFNPDGTVARPIDAAQPPSK